VWSALNFHPLAALTGLIHQMLPWGTSENSVMSGEVGDLAFPTVETQLQCPHCGYQLSTFRQNGRLGCTRCYEAFAPVMESLITSIHGHARHLEEKEGEFQSADTLEVAAPSDPNQPEDSVSRLRNEMKLAIKREKFEEAARLRDEIKKLESQ
jgi:protein arginine kinase activator